jgi:lycopene cyclase domain-containing protein
MKFTYLLVNICSAIIPFAFSFHHKIKFSKMFPAFIKANFIAAAIFIIWDIIFTSNNVWTFNEKYILGIYIFNLPLEEILFFIFIPFACIFTYYCSFIIFRARWNGKEGNVFIIFISVLFFIVGMFSINKSYTSITFITTAVFLVALKFLFKVNWLPQFFSVYPLLLIPFFVVNGILTGTGLEQPVVIYNDSENLGIRVLTIPIEDLVYGLELLLLNVFLFERFNKKIKAGMSNYNKHT